MGLAALTLIWLVPALTCATQEFVTLSVSPQVTAECGEPVTLWCSVSSKRPDELQIKHLQWSQNRTTLCSVTGEGIVTLSQEHGPRDFHCEYKDQQLSLIFRRLQPADTGPYRCKLHANQGTSHGYSGLQLHECCGTAEGFLTSGGPSCTFTHVHPDGDVHWFHGSRRLSDGSAKPVTSKSVEDGGWLTIKSHLERERSDVPYNCSLRSTKSGRYIASALVDSTATLVKGVKGHASSSLLRDGATAARTVLVVSVLLPFTLK